MVKFDGGGFTLLGTMGQANAGSTASGGGFHLIDGLWAIENRAVDSPFATVCGRLTMTRGVGIPRVLVTITNLTTNLTFQTWTQAQGYYRLNGIPTGANYVVAVSHRSFEFNPVSISIFVGIDRDDVDFVSTQ